jgi:thiamine biosynthesis lipoprotein
VRKLADGFIDYSAIAKGYGVDRAAQALESIGFTNFLVEVGGEVRVLGTNASGEAWRLGIEQPDILGRKAYNVAHLKDVSMATSGDYRNFIEGSEGRYSHTIDPKTGYPVSSEIASVSVVMKDCASADAWATALLAMGRERALEYAERKNLAAFFIFREDDGFSSHASKQMQQYLR